MPFETPEREATLNFHWPVFISASLVRIKWAHSGRTVLAVNSIKVLVTICFMLPLSSLCFLEYFLLAAPTDRCVAVLPLKWYNSIRHYIGIKCKCVGMVNELFFKKMKFSALKDLIKANLKKKSVEWWAWEENHKNWVWFYIELVFKMLVSPSF